MSREPESNDRAPEALRELLRRHDPARNAELSPHEAARIRRSVVEATRPDGIPVLRLAVAALLALCVLGAWWLRPDPRPAAPTPVVAEEASPGDVSPVPAEPSRSETPPEEETVRPRDERTASANRPEPVPPVGSVSRDPSAPTLDLETVPPAEREDLATAREIRFETEGGTRLIWIFEPEGPANDPEGVT